MNRHDGGHALFSHGESRMKKMTSAVSIAIAAAVLAASSSAAFAQASTTQASSYRRRRPNTRRSRRRLKSRRLRATVVAVSGAARVSQQEDNPASSPMRGFSFEPRGVHAPFMRPLRRPRECPCSPCARDAACPGTDTPVARARWESRADRGLVRLRGNGRRARRALSCR